MDDHYILPPKGVRSFFAVLGESENQYDEIHGAFTTRGEAEAHSAKLAREYSDYSALRVVVVDVLAVN